MNAIPGLPVQLHSLLGTHPSTRALKSGAVSSRLISFDFFEVKVANTQFKALVREAKYDFGELAMVTFLQAKHYAKPYILLPATIVGRNQHHTIFYNAERGALKPSALSGKRVGVRAYTQTTGCWVRGFLAEEYGVDNDSISWVAFEDAHLAEYGDPSNVVRAPIGTTLRQMLLDGEIDAAILGDVAEEGSIRRLIPECDKAGELWAERHGGVPVNHLAVMRKSIARERPDVVREVYRLLKESRAAADLPAGDQDPLRFGINRVRQSIDTLSEYAVRQRLIPRRLAIDELFDEARVVLGSEAD